MSEEFNRAPQQRSRRTGARTTVRFDDTRSDRTSPSADSPRATQAAKSAATNRSNRSARQTASAPAARAQKRSGHAASRTRQAANATPQRTRSQASPQNIYVGSGPSIATIAQEIPRGAILFLIVFILAIVAFGVYQCSQPVEEPAQEISVDATVAMLANQQASIDSNQQAAQADRASRQLTVQDLENIPADKGLKTFALLQNEDTSWWTPALSSDKKEDLTTAIENITKKYKLGFVFMDLQTGCGISYNVDQSVYGASSSKGPYCSFLCQCYLDKDSPSLVSTAYLDNDQLRENISDSILYSDNQAFYQLHQTVDVDTYNNWCASLGVSDVTYTDDDDYSFYCARSSAKLWLDTDQYLETNTDCAQWLGGLLSQTDRSEIRSALSSAGATVYNKAGWLDDPSSSYDATVDAGIIEISGKRYLMSIMTSLPDSTTSSKLVSNLATALFNCANSLS